MSVSPTEKLPTETTEINQKLITDIQQRLKQKLERSNEIYRTLLERVEDSEEAKNFGLLNELHLRKIPNIIRDAGRDLISKTNESLKNYHTSFTLPNTELYEPSTISDRTEQISNLVNKRKLEVPSEKLELIQIALATVLDIVNEWLEQQEKIINSLTTNIKQAITQSELEQKLSKFATAVNQLTEKFAEKIDQEIAQLDQEGLSE